MRDVIVVGAGPVGSYLAFKLAGMGYEVVVLERRQSAGRKVCCTGIIGRECISSFPVDDNVILSWANSAKLFSPSGRLLKLWRKENQVGIIDRTAFDLAMANRAQGRGVQYVLNSPVWNVEVRNNRVRVEVNRQGERLSFEARAAVIASGFGFRLTEKLGLGRVGDFVVGAQTEVEISDVDGVEVYFGQEIAPGFFAWLVPTLSRRARVGLLARHSPGLYLKRLLSSLRAQGKLVSGEGKLSYGGIPLRPLTRTYGERLIVVGDAAGQVKPTTGGGIYYGLLCAEVAANTLKTALAGNNLSAEKLAAYERGWKRKLGRELRVGYWARKLYERLGDGQIERIFAIIESSGMDKALLEAEDLSFDWHSEVVLRLLGQRAVAKAVEMIKFPLSWRGG